jgi:hypothetical protein
VTATAPPLEEVRAVVARAAEEPDATTTSIAAAVLAYLELYLDGPVLSEDWCAENGCEQRRILGMLTCPEHTAQRLNGALRDLQEAHDEVERLSRELHLATARESLR